MRSVNFVVLALAASRAMGVPLASTDAGGAQSLDVRAESDNGVELSEHELNERGLHGACVSNGLPISISFLIFADNFHGDMPCYGWPFTVSVPGDEDSA